MRISGREVTAAVSDDVQAAWRRRLPLLAMALGRPTPHDAAGAAFVDALDRTIDVGVRQHVWLALAVLSGMLPDEECVVETCRRASLDGAHQVVRTLASLTTTESARWIVRLSGATEVLSDVGDTVRNPSKSGIQRVVRRLATQWRDRPDVTFVAWTPGFGSIRELTFAEVRRLQGADSPLPGISGDQPTVVVPWSGMFVLAELAAEHERAARLRAVAQFSAVRTAALGYDCIPLTTSETVQPGMATGFAAYLAALRHFDVVVTDSEAAATEFEGWRRMLAAIGLEGPQVIAVPLAVQVPEPESGAIAEARALLCVAGLPLVLVVGSHEPRKNHLAVLHAAECLWQRGASFVLAFVGGNGWRSEAFDAEAVRLSNLGHPVQVIRGLSDPLLWGAYRLARFTMFPSLNEGFGLPVAESLALGTPAITSRFGSMAEIAAGGGALVVDPRDDGELAYAMARLLSDDLLLDRLRTEALGRAPRTWREYADDVWAAAMGPSVAAPSSAAGR
jgi:glycosyltransferase involved in cell wall biosynthesis